MKKLFLSLGVLAAAFTAFLAVSNTHAAIKGAPFLPEIDARFNALEGPSFINGKYANFRADSVAVKHTAQATYNFATNGGAVGTHSLLVQIPKNAVIVRSYAYSITKPTTSASGTLAFTCENAGDLVAATAAASYAAAGASIDGASTGAASVFKYIDTAGPCTISAVIATGALTAGEVTVFSEYVLHQ